MRNGKLGLFDWFLLIVKLQCWQWKLDVLSVWYPVEILMWYNIMRTGNEPSVIFVVYWAENLNICLIYFEASALWHYYKKNPEYRNVKIYHHETSSPETVIFLFSFFSVLKIASCSFPLKRKGFHLSSLEVLRGWFMQWATLFPLSLPKLCTEKHVLWEVLCVRRCIKTSVSTSNEQFHVSFHGTVCSLCKLDKYVFE